MSKGYAEQGWRVPGTGALALVGPRHPDTGAPMERVDDVVEDAIEEAITQGVPVTICVADADLDVHGPHRRPAPLLTSALRSVGLDVGGTKVLGVAIDPRAPGDGRSPRTACPTPDGGDGLVDVLLELAARARAGRRGHRRRACPGLVDRAGTLHMGPHLRRMQDVPLAAAARRARRA